MKEVKAFKTNDGEIFETEKEANMHERECVFIAWGKDNLVHYGNKEGPQYAIMDWLIKNKEAVLALYGEDNNGPVQYQIDVNEYSITPCPYGLDWKAGSLSCKDCGKCVVVCVGRQA